MIGNIINKYIHNNIAIILTTINLMMITFVVEITKTLLVSQWMNWKSY